MGERIKLSGSYHKKIYATRYIEPSQEGDKMKHKYLWSTLVCITLVAVLNIVFNYRIQYILNAVVAQDYGQFSYQIMVTAIIILGMLLVEYGRQVLNARYLNSQGFRLHGTLLSRILALRPRAVEQDVGHYLSQVTNDIEEVKSLHYDTLLSVYQGTISFLIAAVALISLNWVTALWIFIASVLPLVLPLLFKRLRARIEQDYLFRKSAYSRRFVNYLQNFGLLRNHQSEGEYAEDLTRDYADINRMANTKAAYSALVNVLAGLGFYATTLVILWIGGLQVLEGKLTVGGLTSIYSISLELVLPIQLLISALSDLSAIQDTKHQLEQEPVMETVVVECSANQPMLAVRQLEQPPLFQGLSLTLQPGKRYLLTGKSGIGKTSLVALLTGDVIAPTGTVLLDKSSLDQLTYEQIQHYIAYVPQKAQMLWGSMWDNITLRQMCDEEEVMRLIQAFGLGDRFPDVSHLKQEQYNEESALSGGQKQRIALIRALLQHKPILIVDEGLSALDPESFKQAENLLLSWPTLTLLHISHHSDEASAHRYDAVFVLEDGQIVRSR
jgi:multidrug ABC transporter, ATP-binding protein